MVIAVTKEGVLFSEILLFDVSLETQKLLHSGKTLLWTSTSQKVLSAVTT